MILVHYIGSLHERSNNNSVVCGLFWCQTSKLDKKSINSNKINSLEYPNIVYITRPYRVKYALLIAIFQTTKSLEFRIMRFMDFST